MKRSWLLAGILLTSIPLAVGMRIEPYRQLLAVEVLADGLSGPAGMALDPLSGELIVAEADAGRISRIAGRVAMPFLTSEAEIDLPRQPWAVSDLRPASDWQQQGLRRPVDVAFDASGNLLVAESGEGGRLLRYHRVEQAFHFAEPIVSPWLEKTLGYASVKVDAEGQIIATMQRAEASHILPFGRVLLRDLERDWLLVDYGPFAEFSNVAISPNGRSMVFAEHRTGDITWYDIERQMMFASMERVRGVRHLAVAADGSTVASVQHADESWSLVEIDPGSKRIWEWVAGLGAVGGLLAHPESGDVYVSLIEEGRILRVYHLHSAEPISRRDKIDALLNSFETENMLAPREWPEFFRNFIERLGLVEAIDRMRVQRVRAPDAWGKVPMSVEQFTSAIPVVAAKVRATLISPEELAPDPIEEFSFVIFFPNRSVHTRQSVAPSISLMHARHRSGKEVRTRFMPNQHGMALTEDLNWDDLPDVLVSFPTGYHAQRSPHMDEGLLRVYFLGMGLGPNYWIDIHRENPSLSKLVVEDPFGSRLEYQLETFPERSSAGGQSVLAAGLADVHRGWINMGKRPIYWNVVLDDAEPMVTRNMSRLEQEAWSHLNKSSAPIFDFGNPALSSEELTFRRALVLRAATRWQTDAL